MNQEELRRKAEVFRSLHDAPPILVLPNAWDVASAKVFELEGFRAIGTTSAGISATLGYPDGQRIQRTEMVEVVGRIARHASVPVSADMEAGYADSTEGVVDSARAFLEAGAAGLNLEDGTGDPSSPLFGVSSMRERISAVKEMTAAAGVPLVLNIRTDVFLFSEGAPDARLRRTVERAQAYREAGADCIFVPSPLDRPGLLDRESIVRLVEEIDAPLNLLGGAVTLPLCELEQIGVARVSLGPGPMRATLALVRRIARELKTSGTYEGFMADTIPYAEVNRWFA